LKGRIHIALLILFLGQLAIAQIPQRLRPVDKTKGVPIDTSSLSDTLPPLGAQDYQLSSQGLGAEVVYGAEDSTFYDKRSNELHMWGNAYVNYLTLSVKADYIVLNLDSNIAVAQGLPDSSGTMAGFPQFKEGANEFEAKKMRYNFKTHKGKIYDVLTQQSDLYIRGEHTKYIGSGGDTTKSDYVYNQSAIITSCDLPQPHYGIRSSKIKTIPNRLAVIGPSNIELMGVPTPLWLPFGFFPVTSSKKAGLIFPRDYEYSEAWGYGLRGIGYYMPLGEHFDARVLGDIYFNGSWGLNVQSNYVQRYKYKGKFDVGYSVRTRLDNGQLNPSTVKSFSLRVAHRQDANAHPYNTLGGSINIQSNDYRTLNYNDAKSVLTNTYSSNFTWSRQFPNKPYSMSVAMSHSQNTQSNKVTIDAPTIDFRLDRIYPFKRSGGGREKWYEKFSIQYTGNWSTRFVTTDSTIFAPETWESAQSGIRHRANADMAFSIAKYLHFTPQIDYEEVWSLKYLSKTFAFDPDKDIVYDTIPGDDGSMIITPDTLDYGPTIDEYKSGFKPFRRVTTAISVTTQLFATMEMKKGFIRGLRHVLKPTLSYSYTPITNDAVYKAFVRDDIRDPMSMDSFSIFEGTVQPVRPVTREASLLSYSLNNIFEAKYYSKKDSTEKKIKLFDNFIVNGNYNIAADSFQLSKVGMRATTRLFKGASTFSLSASFDPYAVNTETGRRVNEFYLKTDSKLLRFEQLQMRFATRLTIAKIKEIFSGKKDDSSKKSDSQNRGARGAQAAQAEFVDLFNGFSINHNFVMTTFGRPGRDTTIIVTNTINMRGSLKLSPKWTINIGNIGYDFRSKQLTYPDIGFSRDLHCWQMSFNWQPTRGTYSMTIGVKPGSLDFLKLPHQNNNQNANTFGGF
jgi:lipopolysaccharide transport LptD-like protein